MPRKLSCVSPRKAEANRQNAQKSTGPRTPDGKANSRQNALKHGLFAMDIFFGGVTNRENPEQFEKLLNALREYYQPDGIAEHLEVERITACWWKLRRVWRYENSEIVSGLIDIGKGQLGLISPQELAPDSALSSEYRTINLLRDVEAEIVATGKISDELKARMDG